MINWTERSYGTLCGVSLDSRRHYMIARSYFTGGWYVLITHAFGTNHEEGYCINGEDFPSRDDARVFAESFEDVKGVAESHQFSRELLGAF